MSDRLTELYRELLIELGEDPEREGLLRTPERAAKALRDFTRGYTQNVREVVGDGVFEEAHSNMVLVRDVELYSMCEHHMLPFFGKIHVAYVPAGKVFGVSKLVRLVEKYSRRLQIQERLTKQVAEELVRMGVKGALVIAEGEHLCMKMRGVRNDSSITTIAHRGILGEKEVREHVLALIYTPKSEIRSL